MRIQTFGRGLLVLGIGVAGAACSSVEDHSGADPIVAGDVIAAEAASSAIDDASSVPAFSASYHMGADISWVPHDEYYGATYVDTDGVKKDILALLKNHGFNSIRLRTFVDPKAADGYDQVDGFADLAHTVTMAKRIKKAGMGFLISIHYSDNWADPGKQCIPVAWQHDTFAQLTAHVHDYTHSLMTALKKANAAPDLVQIGNEISPGMLIHICNSQGLPVSVNAVNGSVSNWSNLAALLKAGVQAVKEVNPSTKIVLHLDKGGNLSASNSWLRNAVAQGVPFDVFADTSYVRWQGQPSAWKQTFDTLATSFPNLSFIIPEYANEKPTSPATPSTMRQANDIIFGLPNQRGIGTWIYEPEHPAKAGVGVGLVVTTVSSSGAVQDPWPVFTALPAAMSVYEQMKTDYASRM